MLAEKLEWRAVGYSSGVHPQAIRLQTLTLAPREEQLTEEEISRRAEHMLKEIKRGMNH